MYTDIVGKQYHFLAGLHRSGNTVLSSILNQHPAIYSSPISSLIEHMWNCYRTGQTYEAAQANNQDTKRSVNLISKMPDIFYEDINKPIIFDRNKAWANPPNVDMIKNYINSKSKIVFTTRPILECVASFIAIDKQTLLKDMNNSDFIEDKSLKQNDNIAEYMLSPFCNFSLILKYALSSIDNPNNNGIIYVVKYEDLLNTPQETMDKIYDFLEMESFKHNFTNIRKIEEYNDAALGFAKDLHKVRRILGRSDIRIEEYLTPYIIEKYKDLRYF